MLQLAVVGQLLVRIVLTQHSTDRLAGTLVSCHAPRQWRAGNSLVIVESRINILVAHLDALALRQTDPWLLLANAENVALTGSELVVYGILDVDNVEPSIMALTMCDDTNTTHVTTASSHCDDTGIELDVVDDLACRQVDLDTIVHLDLRIGIADTTRLLVCDVS